MDLRKRLPLTIVVVLLFTVCLWQNANGQLVTIRGTVYDITARRPLEAIAVFSSSGRGTITDSTGRYVITVQAKDSIWFSLMGKATMKFPVDTISSPDNFNVMIHVYATQLPEVKVRNNYYRFDSIQNRKDYAKIFDFKKPGLRLSNNPNYSSGGLTVGFDLDEIINMFRTKRNQSIENLQRRLIEQEHEKYVSNRFSKQFVRKLTQLPPSELDDFMIRYRPGYEIVTQLNELELGYYIEKCFEEYKAAKYNWRGGLRRREE